MPDYASGLIPNPDFQCTSKTDITRARHGSADDLVEKDGIFKATSVTILNEDCEHSVHPLIQGFKIIRVKGPDILEIQYYNEVFDVSVAALGASWAGRSLLFRSFYWMRLLQTCFRGNDRAFRLIHNDEEFLIGGVCCPHGIRTTNQQLEECWEGGILRAELDGGWKRFCEHLKHQFTRFIWTIIGRHVSGLVLKPLNARKRRGIMQDPLDVVPR